MNDCLFEEINYQNQLNIKRLGNYMNNEIIKFVNGDLQLDVTVLSLTLIGLKKWLRPLFQGF